MKILALDISTKTGYCLFEDRNMITYGLLELPETQNDAIKKIEYPWRYVIRSMELARLMYQKVEQYHPDIIVIEETNKGKNRYSQKLLEQIHLSFLTLIQPLGLKVIYINTSEWRKILKIKASKEDKTNNKKVNEAKKKGVSKKEAGLKGKITIKHLTVRFINEFMGLFLKLEQHNEADAIALNLAFQMGASSSNGEMK